MFEIDQRNDDLVDIVQSTYISKRPSMLDSRQLPPICMVLQLLGRAGMFTRRGSRRGHRTDTKGSQDIV